MIGASLDSMEDNRRFAEKFEFGFPLLSDPDRSLCVAYGACDEVTAKSARRVGVVIGPDGSIREYHPKVDARAFPKEVLERL